MNDWYLGFSLSGPDAPYGAPDTHTAGLLYCRTDIRPQTARFYKECKSTDPSLVTWRSVVYEPPEDGFMRDRNTQGQMLSVLI